MDTYVPTSTSSGILGGKTDDGELDGIQAWKKNMKEKEQKEKDKELAATVPHKGRTAANDGVDEIQMFKMMMQKEQGQDDDAPGNTNGSATAAGNPSISVHADRDNSSDVLLLLKSGKSVGRKTFFTVTGSRQRLVSPAHPNLPTLHSQGVNSTFILR